jgi:uncharacterized membrane protein
MRKFLLLLLVILLSVNCQNNFRSTIIDLFRQKGIQPELTVFMTAMIPIVELRGAIPLGINFYNLPWLKTVLLAILGNILPVLPILILLDKITKLLCHFTIFKRFFDWLFRRTRKKSALIERYELWGLLIFVAIPWPGTGAWTGSLAAFLLGLNTLKALAAICAGVVLAAIIVAGLSLLKFIGLLIVLVIILSLAFRFIINKIKKVGKL